MISDSIMGTGYGTEVSRSVHQLTHLLFGFFVSLLAFGILKALADTCLMDISDVGTEHFVLTTQLIHLVLEFAFTFSQAVE